MECSDSVLEHSGARQLAVEGKPWEVVVAVRAVRYQHHPDEHGGFLGGALAKLRSLRDEPVVVLIRSSAVQEDVESIDLYNHWPGGLRVVVSVLPSATPAAQVSTPIHGHNLPSNQASCAPCIHKHGHFGYTNHIAAGHGRNGPFSLSSACQYTCRTHDQTTTLTGQKFR